MARRIQTTAPTGLDAAVIAFRRMLEIGRMETDFDDAVQVESIVSTRERVALSAISARSKQDSRAA